MIPSLWQLVDMLLFPLNLLDCGLLCQRPDLTNSYFKNLMWFQNRRERGLSVDTGPPDRPNFQLPSDMGLLDDPSTLAIVREFANNQRAFFDAFKVAYTKMVSIGTPAMASL
jgi:catalase (peroxidase I)